ncbi:hypothetical protein [Taylorella equigenitalis]|uniref:Uncharacterized protein n=2 Tax=Taylorella equigenitalis TaxID=29575 RepID=A0A654KF98_TAYEM|nr:hypothetical protein [Taylorella equigenitalis]ADU91080.1 hypothetical protein TEQUI_0124 [Taylorella equigenitalis MCE9]AFN36184.1 hypothetical protein KUI_1119 [Taylorella equigenitalis ATCC 35865]ASY39590.1 hypothetical protein CA604_05615 [Taylorella equigenitalis]WDU48948.1 hypothetical protein KNO34_05495 [Taylorella equigenitalis]WDU51422.1 hypothetical protein KNO32_05475 [Taylorella equigenitalis]
MAQEEKEKSSEQKLKDFLLNVHENNISYMTPEVKNKYEYAYEDCFTQGKDGYLVAYLHKIDDKYIATMLDEASDEFKVMKVSNKEIDLKEALIEFCIDCVDDPIKVLNDFKINPTFLFNDVELDFNEEVFIIHDDPLRGARMVVDNNVTIPYSSSHFSKSLMFENASKAQEWIDSREDKGKYLIIPINNPYTFNNKDLVM